MGWLSVFKKKKKIDFSNNTNTEKIKAYTKEIKKQSKGLISITISSIEQGTILDYYSPNDDVDNQLAATFQAEVLRQITRGLNYIDDLDDKRIQSLTVSLNDQTQLIFTSESKEIIVHIILDNEASNIAIVKSLHKKYRELLNLN